MNAASVALASAESASRSSSSTTSVTRGVADGLGQQARRPRRAGWPRRAPCSPRAPARARRARAPPRGGRAGGPGPPRSHPASARPAARPRAPRRPRSSSRRPRCRAPTRRRSARAARRSERVRRGRATTRRGGAGGRILVRITRTGGPNHRASAVFALISPPSLTVDLDKSHARVPLDHRSRHAVPSAGPVAHRLDRDDVHDLHRPGGRDPRQPVRPRPPEPRRRDVVGDDPAGLLPPAVRDRLLRPAGAHAVPRVVHELLAPERPQRGGHQAAARLPRRLRGVVGRAAASTLDFDALMRPFDMHDPDENPLFSSGDDWAEPHRGGAHSRKGHFDLLGRVTGELELRGQPLPDRLRRRHGSQLGPALGADRGDRLARRVVDPRLVRRRLRDASGDGARHPRRRGRLRRPALRLRDGSGGGVRRDRRRGGDDPRRHDRRQQPHPRPRRARPRVRVLRDRRGRRAVVQLQPLLRLVSEPVPLPARGARGVQRGRRHLRPRASSPTGSRATAARREAIA